MSAQAARKEKPRPLPELQPVAKVEFRQPMTVGRNTVGLEILLASAPGAPKRRDFCQIWWNPETRYYQVEVGKPGDLEDEFEVPESFVKRRWFTLHKR